MSHLFILHSGLNKRGPVGCAPVSALVGTPCGCHEAHDCAYERQFAEALFCLGGIFLKIDSYPDGRIGFEEARRCFRTLSDGPDLLRAGECALGLANVHEY